MDPYVSSSMISAGASILGSAFGKGDSGKKRARMMRKQYTYAQRYQPDLIRANTQASFDARMASFKKHGVHPLFGLGGSTGSTAAPMAIPGQSNSGSHQRDAMEAVAQHFGRIAEYQAKESLINAQNRSAKITLDNQSGNDKKTSIADEIIKTGRPVITHKVNMEKDTSSQNLVEIKPAEQLTTAKGDKSENPAHMSLRRKLYTSNTDWLWMPNVTELDSLMEEPMVSLGIIVALNPEKTEAQIWKQLAGKGIRLGPDPNTATGGKKKLKSRGPFGLWNVYKHE